ncbi:MAG TPA: hypothetical protein VK665_00885 [Candidatus Elarobacter sp.]|nr:hypothetical protein [Candidatus Elarobacter sp.]
MREPLSITVNGERRGVLLLATPEPIPDLRSIWLEGDEYSAALYAGAEDYDDGAYRMRESRLSHSVPGTYRPRAVKVCYTDGTTTTSELADEVVITVPHRRHPGPRPEFKAL